MFLYSTFNIHIIFIDSYIYSFIDIMYYIYISRYFRFSAEHFRHLKYRFVLHQFTTCNPRGRVYVSRFEKQKHPAAICAAHKKPLRKAPRVCAAVPMAHLRLEKEL